MSPFQSAVMSGDVATSVIYRCNFSTINEKYISVY